MKVGLRPEPMGWSGCQRGHKCSSQTQPGVDGEGQECAESTWKEE